MSSNEIKAKANETLIGKTITWRVQEEEFIGIATRVKDHETIVVVTEGNIEHEVDLFDIASTK